MLKLITTILKKLLSETSYIKIRDWYRKYFKKKNPINELRKNLDKFYTFSIRYPKVYRKYSKLDIDENKVLFIEPSNMFSNNFQYMYDILCKNYNFDIHIHLLRNFFVPQKEYRNRCEEMLKDVATAKYVFIDEACNVFAKIHLRKETQIAQTWHACGAFKKFGFSTAELLFGATRKQMEQYPYYRHCSFVAVSSPEVIWAYSEAMGIPKEKILPMGVSRTDVFYDEQFIANARKKLEFFMPSAKGKKVILFAPTFRGRIRKATTATAFSVERFYEELSDDYVLILKHHPHVKKPPMIPEKCRSFAVDFTKVMSIEELLCVSDICISDYSSLVFEYSLFERPMIFFNYDIDEYFDWRGFYYDYDELTPGPSFKTNREMIDYIKHIDERFDQQRVVDFKNKFMSSCDGHSTERLMQKVFGEDLLRHKKSDANAKIKVLQYPINEAEDTHVLADSDKTVRELQREFTELHSEFGGKTIIAYFTENREDKGYPETNPYVDWQDLFEDLDDRYIVVYHGEIPKKHLPKKYQASRFIKCDDTISISELAKLAEVIIADSQFEIGNYCMQTKPTYLYLPDYRWYCADINDYEESTKQLKDSGYLYENMNELIAAIENGHCPERYDESLAGAYKAVCRHFEK